MRAIALSVLTLLSLAAPAAAQHSAQDLFPNQSGNEWRYEITGRIASPDEEIRVVGRSGGWAKVEGFVGTHWWWMSGQSGRIWVWNPSRGTYGLVFDLSANGAPARADIEGAACLDQTEWEVVDRAYTATTPVGPFHDCVVLVNRRPVCADAGVGRIVFAPGVGIVEYGWTTIAGPNTARLSYADVDGKVYAKPASTFTGGLSTRLAIDKPAYYVFQNRMPVVGTPPPGYGQPQAETIKARFEVANEAAEAAPFQFTSSQRYDFRIKDASGQVLYTWSAAVMFMQVVSNMDLLPGETWTYEQDIPLQGLVNALPDGEYVLEAEHTGHPKQALRLKATARFRVQWMITY